MPNDNSRNKHTQIVQVLLQAPEAKKRAHRRRPAPRVTEEEAVPQLSPFAGYSQVYPSFTPGVPTFSPSIDISTTAQVPTPEPVPVPAPAPEKPKSKLKGIVKGIGRGIGAALEAIGELPQPTPGITPIMPPPVQPVEPVPEIVPAQPVEPVLAQPKPERPERPAQPERQGEPQNVADLTPEERRAYDYFTKQRLIDALKDDLGYMSRDVRGKNKLQLFNMYMRGIAQ